MRVPASEKLEIIRLVEQSHLPARRTLQTLGIRPSTFYRWYDRFQSHGSEALEDRSSGSNHLTTDRHYTPKHGSWLDLAESELGVLSSQCLDRRIPTKRPSRKSPPGSRTAMPTTPKQIGTSQHPGTSQNPMLASN